MAKNGAKGNANIGATRSLKKKALTRNPATGLWSERDAHTDRFVDVKRAGGSLKAVRRER